MPDRTQPLSGGDDDDLAERIARAFHGVYETLAPEFGYESRPESRVPWAEVPEKNRALMIGTVRRLMLTGVIQPGTGKTSLSEGCERGEADCPFCDYSGPSRILWDYGDCIVFDPIDPVVPGHVLVVPKVHVEHFTENPSVTGEVVLRAAEWAREVGDCNLITSKGPSATQTVRHLHVHVVPRRPDDELMLPWSTQQSSITGNSLSREPGDRGKVGVSDEELQTLHEQADKLEAEGKLEPIPLAEPPENLMRVIWREADGQQRRCSTYVPLPDNPDLRAALAAARPRFTAYVYDEAERMVKRSLTQPKSKGSLSEEGTDA